MRKATCPESPRAKSRGWFRVWIVLLLLPNFASAQTNYRFTGQEFDQPTELYYYGRRYYDPAIGRFTQPDPLQNFLATPELERRSGMSLEEVLANPQRLNAYSYGLNNPVNVTDPTGEVSQERQERFDSVSAYIRYDDSYWLIRDRDGNAAGLDAIWHRCLELSKNDKGQADIGEALDTFYDAVHIDWAHNKTLDKSREDYLERLNNLPTALAGEYGQDTTNIDKLQHFAASARLAYKYGSRLAAAMGQLKEIKDGFKAIFSKNPAYADLKEADEGYSVGDLYANQAGIQWYNEFKQEGINPSQVINSYLY